MVIGKGSTNRSTGSTKGSIFERKSFTKSSHREFYKYCKRPRHTKDTCFKLCGKENILERMSGNKGSTQIDGPPLNPLKLNKSYDPVSFIFYIILKYLKNNSLLLLMEIMFLLLDLAMSNFSPLYPYTMLFIFLN
ncbi:hypothetical protein CR513_02880, partial [Mucuna pruriens]